MGKTVKDFVFSVNSLRRPFERQKFWIGFGLLLFFFTAFPAAGQIGPSPRPEATYALSVSPVLGFVYGQSEELVYKKENQDTLMSQLIWDLKPLVLWGASLDVGLRYPQTRTGFFIDMTALFSIPMMTGIMEDRDWQAPRDQLSNFSAHTNYTRWATFVDLNTGLSLPIRSLVVFKLYAGFHYMYFKWNAWNGYKQYAEKIPGTNYYQPWTDDIPKESQYGKVISYTQNWFILSPGLSVYVPVHRLFAVNVDFQISPLVFCLDQDEHHLRNFVFNDYMFGGIFLEPSSEIVFSINRKINLTAHVSYRFIRGPRGSVVQKNLSTNTSLKYENLAGAAYSAVSGGFSLKIRL